MLIKTAVKNSRKSDPKEILEYKQETVVDEVTPEEVSEEVVETTEEVANSEETEAEVTDAAEETQEESK